MRRSSIWIREATHDDVAVLARFGEELRDHPAPRRGKCPPRGNHERYVAVLEDPTRRVVLAVDDTDQILGMAIFAVDAAGELLDVPALRVSHLVVGERHRRRGAGRALVAAAASYAEELGVDHVTIGAAPTARESNRFLARLGFAPVTVRRVAPLALLRRNLGLAEASPDGRAQPFRRRPLRIITPLSRPQVRRGAAQA